MNAIPVVNIASAAFKADPYPFYARLREEAPVHRVTLPDKQQAWLVTRYDDVVTLLKDERFVKERANVMNAGQSAPWVPGFMKPLARNMLDVDAPDHTRLKGLVHKAFTPRLIEDMRGRIHGLTHQYLDAVQSKGSMDLIRDYAVLLPTTIIAEMMGVPENDRHSFHRRTTRILSSTASGQTLALITMLPDMIAFINYIRKLIRIRREDPRDDLLSLLVQAEEAGDKLTEDELVGMVALLLIAGHETTVNLIGNSVLSLLQHPAQLEQLRDNPGIIKTATEELARYASPVETATERYTREDVTIAGTTIQRGDLVFGVIASANRDEAQFKDADTLDLLREQNRHLAFGQGMHYCLGAPLARMEGQIALNNLLERMPDLHMTVPTQGLRWRRGLAIRGLESLPVGFARQRATA